MRPTGNWSPARAERETAFAFSLGSFVSLTLSAEAGGAAFDVLEFTFAFSDTGSADLAAAAVSAPGADVAFLGGIALVVSVAGSNNTRSQRQATPTLGTVWSDSQGSVRSGNSR